MKYALVAALALLPLASVAGGLLGDAVKDLNKATANIGKDVARVDVERAVGKIERAEIAQAVQVDALAKRVLELEGVVRKQQELLVNYQKLITELQAKVGGGK